MRLPRSVKEPAELLCFLWDGEAERGRPSAFLCHVCSHGHEQRALFSTDRSCVRDPPSLYHSSSSPPSIHDEYVSFFSCQSLKYGQMKTQTQRRWMKPLHTTHRGKNRHTHGLKSPMNTVSNTNQEHRKHAETISRLINKLIRRK